MFFGAATFGFTESNFSAETLLCEFVGAKADLLAERMLSLVWQVHVVSVALLKVRIVSSFSAALFVPSGFIE
ncbi:hypothetical protein ATN50_01420 [Vibrio parahaemolyticus]|uniref:hypothetical protein n=1 Tax=Vibrio parahaemolyticus TaxID=670 RepID=UPI00040B3C1A|nr:hypothetical protein [Vibrio parahaemolyticus]RFD56499.1 hypothetical protein H332_016890 [Vibrio parahaemolyticus 3646]RFD58178.1 hypothetical protein H330_018245 [Vibrio parahaemolyticus 3631]EGQ7779573.1 hypothetical protein [Vibrio parahaemolyticus]EGQ9050398.1 hypothetical protein [Vibrio parahaemolyticus]EGQ9147198.1 hypothetical protein [Vibrio parahaemolyticus]